MQDAWRRSVHSTQTTRVMSGTRGRNTGDSGEINRIPGEPCALKGARTVRGGVVERLSKGSASLSTRPGWSLVRPQLGLFLLQKVSGLVNGSAPKLGGSRRATPGRANIDSSFPRSMAVLAGPAGHGKGELHWIARNTIHPPRVNGDGVSISQLQCPGAFSRSTTGTLW